MLVQDPETGEWYDEEEEGARTEKMIADEGVKIEPGYRYDFSAEGELQNRVPKGEIVGYGDRVIGRKGGEGWRTASGNEPMPDYFESGGYKGKPDDPHKDADVIYYPDEIHTKKPDGTWNVAPRLKPPGKKPSDTDLSVMEKWDEFKTIWMEKNQLDPEAPEKAADNAKRDFLRKINAGVSITSQALRGEQRDAQIEDAASQRGEQARQREQTQFDRVMNLGKDLFSKQYAKDEEARKNKRESLEEAAKNKREAEEEETRHRRGVEEKKAVAAEKLSEETKLRLNRIKEDRRDLKRTIANNRMLATVNEPMARNMEMWQDELRRLDEEEKRLLQKPAPVEKAKEAAQEVTEQTVTIDGKQYRDGDIVVRNGKKFRVRVKK